jgi:hypothetical protein
MASLPFTADLTSTPFRLLAELLGDIHEFECTCEAEVELGEVANVIVTAVFVGAFKLTKHSDRMVAELAREIAVQAEFDDDFCRAARLAEGVVHRGGRPRYLPDPDRQREDRVADELMDAAE